MMNQGDRLDPILPIKPVAPWLGGKRALAKRLVRKINRVEHIRYIEPFVGMGGVFFRRDRRPKTEVINDLSSDVINLFRLLQRHYPQLLDTLKWQICSRADFERLARVDPETLTDLERAARFLFLQKSAFGGVVSGRSFGVSYEQSARFDLTKLVPMLEDVHERLSPVNIERLPFDECIRRYDRPDGGSLFYVDPPYWSHENDYGKDMFKPSDFALLRDSLKEIKGKFIMSINDVPEIRAMFNQFDIEPVELNYSVGMKPKLAQELIIANH